MLLSATEEPHKAIQLDANGSGTATRASEDDALVDQTSIESSTSSIPSHPLGVKPLGNQYLSDGVSARKSLGTFKALPDEVLSQLLEYLDHQTLRKLGYTCKFFYAFCYSDEFWKPLFLESHNDKKRPFTWRGTWRSTLLELSKEKQSRIDCRNVFSDVLHRPFVCSNISLDQYCCNIPQINEIKRFQDLTYEDFAAKWADKPFILTECIKSWPVTRSWNLTKLLKLYRDVEFRAEAVDWSFSTYFEYMTRNQDESPLYLFDRKFAEKMSMTVGKSDDAAYWKPDCFGPDLFELLGAERPAHRWLIIGPARSGSTFHKDPNGTSAWNAVIQGAKYWIMFPPTVSVPGVYVSQDNSEVTSPLSIAEWLLEFHEEARQLPGCREGICKAGEILHVPSGWWHLVVNLESGIALTQNFVPNAHLAEVLSFLKERAEQVSGFNREVVDPYSLFIDRLKQQYPELLDEALEEVERRNGRKKRRWDVAIGKEETDGTQQEAVGFSFGFGGDDDDEIP